MHSTKPNTEQAAANNLKEKAVVCSWCYWPNTAAVEQDGKPQSLIYTLISKYYNRLDWILEHKRHYISVGSGKLRLYEHSLNTEPTQKNEQKTHQWVVEAGCKQQESSTISYRRTPSTRAAAAVSTAEHDLSPVLLTYCCDACFLPFRVSERSMSL